MGQAENEQLQAVRLQESDTVCELRIEVHDHKLLHAALPVGDKTKEVVNQPDQEVQKSNNQVSSTKYEL